MKQLEDKIKERLEGYESRLPEGDLTEFKAILDRSAADKKQKRSSLIWLVPAAIAAGIALLIMLPPSNFPTGGRQKLLTSEGQKLPTSEEQKLPTSGGQKLLTSRGLPLTRMTVRTELPQQVPATLIASSAEADSAVSETPLESSIPTDSAATIAATETSAPMDSSTSTDYTAASVPSVYSVLSDNSVNSKIEKKDKKKTHDKGLRLFYESAGVAALATVLLPTMLHEEPYKDDISGLNNNNSHLFMYYDALHYAPPHKPDVKTGDDSHAMPLRLGLSLRLPLSKRWSLTSGVDYSMYSSKINYSISNNHQQRAQYIGIPLRADFTILHRRWMDIYAGAGASADFCIYAQEGDKKIDKDGVTFSLNGAAGVQLNITKKIGIFLDPTLSWNIPTDNLKLETYKSNHQFMFTLSSGVRITLRK